MTTTEASSAREIRGKLNYPIVDGDGHFLELTPAFIEYIRETEGEKWADAYTGTPSFKRYFEPWVRTPEERWETWAAQNNLWGVPTKNTLDRATAMLPNLYAKRMDDLGIDYSILYPSEGLFVVMITDDELRDVACRAYNGFVAELARPHADRMTATASIPMNTPEEAIKHLEYAVKKLGLKTVCMAGFALRPVRAAQKAMPRYAHMAQRVDYFGLDSEYDYDPVWAKCVELGVAPTFHSASPLRAGRSVTNYTYNHIGSIAQAQEGLSKALFFGGVTHRFPELNFGFLECGAAWACNLYSEIVGHWNKRSLKAMEYVDPAKLDRARLLQLIAENGDARMHRVEGKIKDYVNRYWEPLPKQDDFSKTGVTKPEDVRDQFVSQFYIGCEADDRSVAWAFNTKINPFGEKIRVMFGSDIGHWDVLDVSGVVHEAYEMVEDSLITEGDFKEFMFSNPVELHARVNPNYFKGTRVEQAVDKFLKEGRK